MRDFRSLKVWGKAHRLTLEVYQATQDFPSEERYGLSNQLRRAATSVPTNIAEGCGRGSEKELAQFVQIAIGSASETEYLLELVSDLEYLDVKNYKALTDQTVEVRKMLIAFIRTLKSKG